MHEFGIAQGLLDVVLNKAHESSAGKIEWIKLDIGVLSGVDDEALQFAFTALADGTIAAHALLKIEHVPLQCFCGSCETLFAGKPFSYRCPQCGKASGDVRTGKEMNLVAMEVT